MTALRLTKREIENIPFTQSGQIIYRDDLLKGFGLRVGSKSKVFIVEGQVQKRTKRVTIGRADVLSPDVARKKALSLLGEMSEGVDPIAEKKRISAQSITLEMALNDFIANRPNLAQSTKTSYERIVKVYLTDWQSKPLVTITRQMVLSRHQKISGANGKVTANGAFRVLRSIFNYTAANYDEFPQNPVTILTQARSWNRETRRQTIVPAYKLKDWWLAVNSEDELARDILIVALFTGMRRNEVLSLDWQNIDLLGRTITIPKTKNGDTLTLPLSSFLHELFERRQELTGNSPWVFPSVSASGHVEETKKMVARVSQVIDHKFTMHDLRRTYITIAESLDIPHYALKQLLNHRTGGDVTGGYIVMNPDRLRAPVEKVAQKILELVDGKDNQAN